MTLFSLKKLHTGIQIIFYYDKAIRKHFSCSNRFSTFDNNNNKTI